MNTQIIKTLLCLLLCNIIYSQDIEIGQEARYVKTVVEWSTSKQNKSNPFKKTSEPYWTWDSKYDNGELTEVSQCYQNQYLIDFQIRTDYCERYIMKKGKLHHTIKEFKNISLDQIKEKYISKYAIHKIDDKYFEEGFGSYYKFNLNRSNIASIEYYKTNISEWDKKTQQNFSVRKKAIEKKWSEDIFKDLMSKPDDKSYYDKQIRIMEAEIKQNTTDKGSGTGSIKCKDTMLANIDRTRKIIVQPKPLYKCNEWGNVAVFVIVDSSGKVLEATAGSKGTTNFADCLVEEAKLAALRTRWEPLYNSDEQQAGTITYNFKTLD